MINAGLHKVNGNVLCKEKFSSILSRHGMNNVVVKSRLSQVPVCCCMIALRACEFPPNKCRKGDSSSIAVPLEWDFESECHSATREYNKSVNKDNLRLISLTPSSAPAPLCWKAIVAIALHEKTGANSLMILLVVIHDASLLSLL